MQKIKDWSPHIIRHFWYCSSACRQDETTTDKEALRLMKVNYMSNSITVTVLILWHC